MKPRFQADNDLDQRIVVAIRRLDSAVDFRTAAAELLRLLWTASEAEEYTDVIYDLP